MTDISQTSPPPQIRLDWVIIALVVLLSLGVFLYLAAQRQYVLRESTNGFDGLKIWLNSESQPTQSFTGGWPLDRSTIGLLVQPIFDTHPDTDRKAARTKEELLLQTDEFDQQIDIIQEKAGSVQSLIILPKWRSGMRLTGYGHPFLLAPRGDVQTVLHQIVGPDVGQVFYMRTPFSDFDYDGDREVLAARVYAGQAFEGIGCEPVIGRPGAMLLGLCPLPGDEDRDQVYVLSDPDVLNNHGLRLGENALIAAQLLPQIAGENRIVIDYSDRNWLTEPEQIVQRERTWEDLARLFEYPFRILWIGAALLLALAIWRGGIRNGPVTNDGPSLGTGKRAANRARARLMRLTGQDGALLSDFVNTRIRAQAAEVFGPGHVVNGGVEAAYLRYMRARQPALAAELTDLLGTIRGLPAHLNASDAITYIDKFESILERFADDA
ncbi:hypothetical protein [Roseibium sp. RKSG952]|uniref:hypothetical protein n=1 Tax=Roseibium sp. RKSG952 TaxID=2529384 RepID=UPI0012BC9EC3|nr:hypothetical protein [Roseibium sp. RKSG952]MTI00883.1 hypothetical protein [Roseibium sp. RKSG952]